MKRIFFLIWITILPRLVRAQSIERGKIEGVLKDTITNYYFENSSILVINKIDSTVNTGAFSNSKGYFSINNLRNGSYYLLLSSVQFNSKLISFEISEQSKTIDFGIINLERGKKLEDVTVVGLKPIRVKGDTVEYLANAFKTTQNSTLEDLLKKLPGVSIDKNGTIVSNGKAVIKVYLDGKPFFGGDSKIATKNLPSAIIDKVQIIDRKNEVSQFTGFDDGNTEKIINITIKKTMKKGSFTKLGFGAGIQNKFDANVTSNYFNNGMQLSLISQANNINKEGFGFQDILDFNGNYKTSVLSAFSNGLNGIANNDINISYTKGNGSNNSINSLTVTSKPTGIINTKALGFNFSNTIFKKVNVSFSYFFNQSKSYNGSQSFYQTYPNNPALFTATTINQVDTSHKQNHRFNLDFDWKIDKNNSIQVRPTIIISNKSTQTNNDYSITDDLLNKLLTSIQLVNVSSSQPKLYSTILWKHKTKKQGRTLSAKIGYDDLNVRESNFNLNSISSTSSNGNIYIDQFIDNTTYNRNLVASVNYTEPIRKNKLIEFSYTNSTGQSSIQKFAYNKNINGQYEQLDSSISTIIKSKSSVNQIGANFQVKLPKSDFAFGLSLQNTVLKINNYNFNKNSNQQHYLTLLPNARFSYNFGNNKQLKIYYRTKLTNPSISLLQSVTNNTNYYNTITGNPGLKPEFTNELLAIYSHINFTNFKSLFIFFNATKSYNAIIDSVVNISKGIQYTKPINAIGIYKLSSNIAYTIPLNTKKSANLSLQSFVSLKKQKNIFDGYNNNSFLQLFRQTIELNWNYKDKLDILFSTSYAINNLHNSLRLIEPSNTKYFNATIDLSYQLPHSITLQSDIDLNNLFNSIYNKSQDVTLLNCSISKSCLKSKSLEFTLSAFDILHNSKGYNFLSSDYYISKQFYNVQQNYYMLSVKYAISKFAGKSFNNKIPKSAGSRSLNYIRITQ